MGFTTISISRTYANGMNLVRAQGLAPLPIAVNDRICVSPNKNQVSKGKAMTNSEPPRRRRPALTLDEIIACIVALGTMGTIFYFGTRPTGQSWFKGQSWFGATSTTQQSGVVPPLNSLGNQAIAKASPNSEPQVNQLTPRNSPSGETLPSVVPLIPLAGSLPIPSSGTTPQNLATPNIGASSPIVSPSPEVTSPVVSFPDVQDNYWAKPFIGVVAGQKLMTAIADGRFAPDQAMTRADFAQALQQVLALPTPDGSGNYPDVGTNNPAIGSIQAVTKAGFMKGYPDGQFKPNQPVTRQDVLVTLMSGLGLQPPQDAPQVLQVFQDANQIPAWANGKIAAATANNLVVNYPDVKVLQPQKTATRAEVAAFLYQALVKQGKAKPVNSPYVVKK